MPFTVPNRPDVNYTDLAEPDSVDFQIATDTRFGVFSGGDASQQGSTSMVVSITGVVVLRNGQAPTVVGGNVTIGAASPNHRFDLIVVNSSNALAVVSGAPGSTNPRFPVWDHTSTVLYAVYVPAGTTWVTNDLIIDKRRMIPAINLSGSGSPEGSVTAPVGALWVNTAGDAGTYTSNVWAKESGTSNTGWQQLAQAGSNNVGNDFLTDTQMAASNKLNVAWITPTLSGSWSGSVRYTKIGNTGFVVTGPLTWPSGSTTIFTLPGGYRPPFNVYVPGGFINNGGPNWSQSTFQITTSGTVSIVGQTSGLGIDYYFSTVFPC